MVITVKSSERKWVFILSFFPVFYILYILYFPYIFYVSLHFLRFYIPILAFL